MICKKKISALALGLMTVFGTPLTSQTAHACTRILYVGEQNMVATGRNMDWKEDMKSDLWIFPRGMARNGLAGANSLNWESRYGSVITSGYGAGSTDGMNEKGLVANLLFLVETDYGKPSGKDKVLALSLWLQYFLDNYATVDEAVAAQQKNPLHLVFSKIIPNGSEPRLHLSVSDSTGDSAIFEYVDGKLNIYHSREYKVLTNSPVYNQQLAINNYWKEIGGLQMLPGTNRASDRFVRASFYIHAIPQIADAKIAVSSVLSVMRNVSVPFGINTPEKPYISSTRWRSVSDQKNKVYYFESTLTPNLFWLDLKKIDFSPKAGIKKLSLTKGEIYAGDAVKDLKDSQSFTFLFETPVM